MDRARRSALRSAVAALAACAVPLSAQVVTPLASGAPLNTTLLGGGLTYFSFTRNVSLPVPADATFSVDVVPLAALAPAAGAPIAVWVTSDVDAGGLPVKPTCGAAAPCNGVDNVPQVRARLGRYAVAREAAGVAGQLNSGDRARRCERGCASPGKGLRFGGRIGTPSPVDARSSPAIVLPPTPLCRSHPSGRLSASSARSAPLSR